MLNVVDEFTHECLAIRVDRKLKAIDVIETVLSDLSSCVGCRGTFVRTMARSSSPSRCSLDHRGRCQDGLHQPRFAVGERLCRELQTLAFGRTPEWRDLLHAQGGTDRDRELETTLQRCPPPRVARIPSASPGGVRCSLYRLPAALARPAAPTKLPMVERPTATLTSILDHLVGADQNWTSQRFGSPSMRRSRTPTGSILRWAVRHPARPNRRDGASRGPSRTSRSYHSGDPPGGAYAHQYRVRRPTGGTIGSKPTDGSIRPRMARR